MWPFKHKQYVLEYSHVTGRDLVKFTIKSNDMKDLLLSHMTFVDKFLKDTERQKKQFSTKEKEAMK